jgi:RHS repeat-associated protein
MAVTRQKAYGLTTTYTYYGTDHLGTVRSTVVLSSTGVPQSTTFHDYEPFGVEIPGAVSYTSANTHRYTGQERDGLYNPATGATDYLDYMHFRSTAVNLGRFMRPDNIGGNMGNPQSWNLYSYVVGNPVNLNDPTGHMYDIPERQGPREDTSLEEYLYGGASVSETVTHYTVRDQSGNALAWGSYQSDFDVARSIVTGQLVGAWLTALKIPKDQQGRIIDQLKAAQAAVGTFKEQAVAIRAKNGYYDVYMEAGKDSQGEPTQTQFDAITDSLMQQGYSVIALGHAHFSTGNLNPLTGSTTVEGASRQDAANYGERVRSQGVSAGRFFVLGSNYVHVFRSEETLDFWKYSW